MSNIFDLNTLLSENSLSDELLAKDFSKETYMFSAINYLREFNSGINDINKTLYRSLNEASSKAEENAIFANFFDKYNGVLNKYISEVNSMVGRFSITIDNIVDANETLLRDQDVLTCSKPFSYSIKKYKNLCAKKYPKFEPLAIYQTEFDYIGKLLQDLGPVATDIAKLEVISSVVNAFSNKIKNDWIEKCMEDIVGDECDDTSDFAKKIKELFVEDEEEITVNKWLVYTYKEEISSYDKYKDCVLSIANKLIQDFTSIGQSIGSLFFRNKDNVLPVRSSNPDVESRDYQLNTYGMNQLDIFMKAKVNQVTQMCSLYVIALSVMMDSVLGYITQCKDVLEAVKDACDSSDETNPVLTSNDNDGATEEPEEDPNNEEAPDEIEEDDEQQEVPEEPADDEQTETFDIDSEPEAPDEEEPVPPETESEQQEVPEEPVDSSPNSPEDQEFKNESYIYEYMMYNIDNIIQQEMMMEYVRKDILREADGDRQNATGVNMNDANIIQKLFNVFKELFLKYQNLYQKSVSKKAEFINKSKATLNSCNLEINGENFKVTSYNTGILEDLKVVPLNYDQMKEFLVSEQEFVKKYYPSIADAMELNSNQPLSIKDAINSLIITNENAKDIVTAGNVYNKILDYVTNYGKVYKSVSDDYKDIVKAQTLTGTIARQYKSTTTTQTTQTTTNNTTTNNAGNNTGNTQAANASYYFNTADDYLNEDVETPQAPKGQTNNSGNPVKQIRLYFNVMTRIVSCKMNSGNMIFNDYFKILNTILQYNGKEYYKNPAKGNNNQQQANNAGAKEG